MFFMKRKYCWRVEAIFPDLIRAHKNIYHASMHLSSLNFHFFFLFKRTSSFPLKQYVTTFHTSNSNQDLSGVIGQPCKDMTNIGNRKFEKKEVHNYFMVGVERWKKSFPVLVFSYTYVFEMITKVIKMKIPITNIRET